MPHPLTHIQSIREDIAPYLARVGQIFQVFDRQDSGCVSYGVQVGEERFFVKHSLETRGVAGLLRAAAINSSLRHPGLPALRNMFSTPNSGLALVFQWSTGEALYGADARRRFHALPAGQILAALDTIYAVHRRLAEKGYIAVDFYDGCILYDFTRQITQLCDLDEYHQGPFINEAGWLPGSKRFMAPEEFEPGGRIDQATNVFTLGRAAFVLLSDSSTAPQPWRGSPGQYAAALQAVSPERDRRYASVADFIDAWQG